MKLIPSQGSRHHGSLITNLHGWSIHLKLHVTYQPAPGKRATPGELLWYTLMFVAH